MTHNWLPVQRRIEFKLGPLTCKTLHNTAPPYLSDECQFMSDADRRLRSSAVRSFVVPRSRTRLADRSFVVADPRVWNKVPASVHLREDSEYFKRLLKAHLI